MSEGQVKEQLAQYGSWLQSETGSLLSPPLKAEVVRGAADVAEAGPMIETEASAEFGARNFRLVLGAAAAFVLLVVGLAVFKLVSIGEDSVLDPVDLDSVELPYVLPPAGYETRENFGSSYLYENGDPDYLTRTTLIGVFDGEVYSSRLSLSVLTSDPGPLDGEIAEQRGEIWLVLSAADDVNLSQRLLEAAEIDANGFASLSSQYGYAVIAKFFEGPDTHVTSANSSPSDEGSYRPQIWVETANEHPLVNAELRVGDLTQIQVRGTQGWSLYVPGLRDYMDYYWVAWATDSGGMVSLSTRGDYDGLLAFAEELNFVDEEAWLAEYPQQAENEGGHGPSLSREEALRFSQMSLTSPSLCDLLYPSLQRGEVDPGLGLPDAIPKPLGEPLGLGTSCGPANVDIAVHYSDGVLLVTSRLNPGETSFTNSLQGGEFQFSSPRKVAEGVYVVGDVEFTNELTDLATLYDQTRPD